MLQTLHCTQIPTTSSNLFTSFYHFCHCQLKAGVLTSSSEKDGGDVINDFDIEEEEILIENRFETGPRTVEAEGIN